MMAPCLLWKSPRMEANAESILGLFRFESVAPLKMISPNSDDVLLAAEREASGIQRC